MPALPVPPNRRRQEGKTRLTVSVWNYEGTPEFKALFDSYEAANPDIDIEPVDILADDYPQKVTTMLAGGDTTDVLTMKNVIDYARYANNGQLQEINSVVDTVGKDNLAGLDAFNIGRQVLRRPLPPGLLAALLQQGPVQGRRHGGPRGPDLGEVHRAGQEAHPPRPTARRSTAPTTTSGVRWCRPSRQPRTAPTRTAATTASFEDQYNTALDLQKSGATLDFGTAKSQKTSYRTMFETGQAAMMPMGTWYIAGILQAKKDGKTNVNWGLAPMPQKNDDGKVTTFGSPTAFAVNKNATHSDEAKKFIEWAAGEEGAKAISKIGVVPALQNDAITAEYFKLDGMPTDELSKKAFTPDKIALEMPVSDKSAATDKILNQEHDLIMVGERSVSDGIAEMGKRVKSEVLGQ